MSGQKQNLLFLMIICCALCQISTVGSNKAKLIIQVNSSDHFFWNSSSSTVPDIKWTCLSNDKETITLKISSPGQCSSYSFSITKHDNYEFRMNETVEGITLWLVSNGCTSDDFVACQSSCTYSQHPTYTPHPNHSGALDGACTSKGVWSNTHQSCGNSKSVDPEEKCKNVVYNQSKCNENEGSKYILKYNQSNEWTCVTCFNGSSTTITPPSHTTTTHNQTTSFTSHLTTPGYNEPSKASEALEKLGSKLEEMEKNNTSNAAIVMGDVIGLVHVQAKNTETKETNICFSSDHAMVVENQSDMNTNSSWSVKISKEALNKSRLVNNGTAFVGVLRFYNMRNKDDTKYQTVLNDEVYGITMRANISNLTDNIDMYFRRNNKVGKPSCSSWDGKGKLNWTTSGCVTETIDNTVKCSCSHLTFFAVLMSPPDASNNTVQDLEQLTLISSIGCGISMFFLAIALFMHFLLRKAKSNQATKILMNMFVALSLLNASFLSNESVANTGDNAACVFIALLLHYSMLASFTWFFIQALHMYLWLIRQNISITNYMRKITVLGWVFPAPIVIAIASVGEYKTVIIKATSGKNSQMCWITNSYIHYIVNIGYYALVFIFTTGIFIMIVSKVVQGRNIKAVDGKRKTFRKQLMMVLSLFLLFGLTWSVAFFSYGPMLIPSYYIFTVLNSLQGFFLFLYYYYIHNDVAGSFSDDPENTDSNTAITQSSINAVDNIYN